MNKEPTPEPEPSEEKTLDDHAKAIAQTIVRIDKQLVGERGNDAVLALLLCLIVHLEARLQENPNEALQELADLAIECAAIGLSAVLGKEKYAALQLISTLTKRSPIQ